MVHNHAALTNDQKIAAAKAYAAAIRTQALAKLAPTKGKP